MKNSLIAVFILTITLMTSTAFAENTKKVLLTCSEKWSSFEIAQQGDKYLIERTVVLDRVKGNPFVSGSITTESQGVIEALSHIKTKDSLTLNLAEGLSLTFKLGMDPQEDTVHVKFSSNAENVDIQTAAILGIKENELAFYSIEACEIK